ncbi:13787_t:CDS:1, partial [Ambispora leptoticha]
RYETTAEFPSPVVQTDIEASESINASRDVRKDIKETNEENNNNIKETNLTDSIKITEPREEKKEIDPAVEPLPKQTMTGDVSTSQNQRLVDILRQQISDEETPDNVWKTYTRISAKDALNLLTRTDYMDLLVMLKTCEAGFFLLDCLNKIRDDLRYTELELENQAYNLMLHLYGLCKEYKKAETVLTEMTHKGIPADVYTLTSLISAYVRTDRTRRAIQIYRGMQKGSVKPNIVTYNTVLLAYVRESDLKGAHLLLEEMDKYNVKPDTTTYNTIIHGYIKKNDLMGANKCLEMMESKGLTPDIFTINTLIAGYCKCENIEPAMRLYHKIYELNLRPDVDTFNTLMACYARLGRKSETIKLFEELKFLGRKPTLRTFNVLIYLYTKINDYQKALETLDLIKSLGFKPDVITYNTFIAGYVKKKNLVEAIKWYETLKSEELLPNVGVFNTLLRGYLWEYGIMSAGKIFEEMQKYNVEPDSITYNTLMQYIRFHGNSDAFGQAIYQYEQMLNNSVRPSGRTFSIMLTLATENALSLSYPIYRSTPTDVQDREIDSILREMKLMGIKMDIATFAIMIRYYIRRGDMESATELFQKMIAKEIHPNKFVYSILIDGYIKQRKMDMAERVVEKMRKLGIAKDLKIYTSLINGYISVEEYGEAVREFAEMKHAGVEPDKITYTSLIEMYAKNHDIETAQSIFDYMQAKGIPIDAVAFTALIKAYGKDRKAASTIYHEMIASGHAPDHILIQTMLRAYKSPNTVHEPAVPELECTTESYNELLRELIARSNTAEFAYEIFIGMLASDKTSMLHSQSANQDINYYKDNSLPAVNTDTFNIIFVHLIKLNNWPWIWKIWDAITKMKYNRVPENIYLSIIKALVIKGDELENVIFMWNMFLQTNPTAYSLKQMKNFIESMGNDFES